MGKGGQEEQVYLDLNRDSVSAAEIVETIDAFDLQPDSLTSDTSGQKKQAFVDICQNVLDTWDNTLIAQGYPPSSAGQRRLLVKILYLIASAFKNEFRLSGDPVFDMHLAEAAINAMEIGGAVDLISIIGAAAHDIIEDVFEKDPQFPKHHNGALKYWKNFFSVSTEEGFSEADVQSIVKKMYTIVVAVTKSRGGSSEAHDKTFRSLLEGIENDLRTLLDKLSDRLNNMETLGHHTEAKQLAIAKQTMDIYVQLAGNYGYKEFERILVDLCMDILKPDIVSNVRDIIRTKIESRLGRLVRDDGKYAKTRKLEIIEGSETRHFMEIKRRLEGIEDVAEIRINGASLSDYIVGLEWESAGPEMFEPGAGIISTKDTMFEICILTKPLSDDAKNKERINNVVGQVMQAFGSEDGANAFRTNIIYPEGTMARGVPISVLNQNVGGRLKMRVNDLFSEAKMKKAPMDDKFRPHLSRRREIRNLLRYVDEHDGVSLLETAHERYLRRKITVFTPGLEAVEGLSEGATGLDFAAAAVRSHHLLLGLQSMRVSRPNVDGEKNFSPLDPLKDGYEYEVTSCLKPGIKNDWDAVRFHPVFFEFAGDKTHEILRKWAQCPIPRNNANLPRISLVAQELLKHRAKGGAFVEKLISSYPELEAVVESGKNYCREIAQIFNMTSDDILQLLIEEHAESSETENEIYFRVAVGEISIIETLVYAARFQGLATFEFECRNVPNVFANLSSEFGKMGINIDSFDHAKTGESKDHRQDFVQLTFDLNEVDLKEVLKVLLKMKYDKKYKVHAVGKPLVKWKEHEGILELIEEKSKEFLPLKSLLTSNGFDCDQKPGALVRYDHIFGILDDIQNYLLGKRPSAGYTHAQLSQYLGVIKALKCRIGELYV